MHTIYKSFINVHFSDDIDGSSIGYRGSEKNAIWVADFMLYINIFMLFCFVIVIVVFNEELVNMFDEEEPANVEECAAKPEEEVKETIKVIDTEAVESSDGNPKDLNEDISKTDSPETPDGEPLESGYESSRTVAEMVDLLEENTQTESTNVSSNDEVASISPDLKPSKNFVNINIQNVKSLTSKSCGEPKSVKKSLIPVRKVSSRSVTPVLYLQKPSSSICWMKDLHNLTTFI